MDLDTAKVIQDIFNHKVDLLSKNTIFQFCRVPLLSSTLLSGILLSGTPFVEHPRPGPHILHRRAPSESFIYIANISFSINYSAYIR